MKGFDNSFCIAYACARHDSIARADATPTGEGRLNWSDQGRIPSIESHTENDNFHRFLFVATTKTDGGLQLCTILRANVSQAQQSRSELYSAGFAPDRTLRITAKGA